MGHLLELWKRIIYLYIYLKICVLLNTNEQPLISLLKASSLQKLSSVADIFLGFFQYHGEYYLLRTPSQLTFSCSKSTIETLENGASIVAYEQVNVNWVSTAASERYQQQLIQHQQKRTIIAATKTKKSLWPLFMDGVQLPQCQSHFEEAIYFFVTKLPEIPGTHFITSNDT